MPPTTAPTWKRSCRWNEGEAAINGPLSTMNRLFPAAIPLVLLTVACRVHPGPVAADERPAASKIQPPESLDEVTGTFTAITGRESTFVLEVADTPETRSRGLMHRRTLPADRGMVFRFPREEDQTFYMKNTHIPLDMVFVDSRMQVVGVVENARPLTLTTRSVGRPSRYVIELNAHAVRTNGIGPGTRVLFDPPLADIHR